MQDHPQDDGIQTGLTSNRVQQAFTDGMQSVEVEYSLQVDDALALQEYHLAHTTGAARSRLWWALPVFFFLIGSLALTNIVFTVMNREKPSAEEIMIATVIMAVVVGYCFRRPLLRAILRRNIRHERDLFLPHRVVVTPEALEYRVGPNTTRTLWVGIAKIGLTEQHLFLYTTPNTGLIVPRRTFRSERDFENFCKLTQRYFRITTQSQPEGEGVPSGSPR